MYLLKAAKLDSVLQIISNSGGKSVPNNLQKRDQATGNKDSSLNHNSSRASSLYTHSGSECTSMEGNDSIREGLQSDECSKLLGILPQSSERRNDREEIRRKLAMDSDNEEYYCGERVPSGKKPSLTTRLQSGMNLQICFMNETASDLDSQHADHDLENGNARIPPSYGPVPTDVELTGQNGKDSLMDQRISALLDSSLILDSSLNLQSSRKNQRTSTTTNHNASTDHQDEKLQQRPSFFFNRQRNRQSSKDKNSGTRNGDQSHQLLQNGTSLTLDVSPESNEDFVSRHARLQAEARHALFQAKEMARMQMEVEKQRKKKSPIADIVGIPFLDGWHNISRHVLTDMNVAQLQVIVNDLHSQIESLNDDLVRLLLERDDLHMEQDSMLVDIEDLTRYLGAKGNPVSSFPVTSQL